LPPRFSYGDIKKTQTRIQQQSRGKRPLKVSGPSLSAKSNPTFKPKTYKFICLAENGKRRLPTLPRKFYPYYNRLVQENMIQDITFHAENHGHCYETVKTTFNHLGLNEWQFLRANGTTFQSIEIYDSSNFNMGALAEYVLLLNITNI
jgi:hypothetical protein